MRYERIHSIIEEHNADPTSTYKMGHNEFSVLVSFLIKKSWIIDVIQGKMPATVICYITGSWGVKVQLCQL